MAKGFQTGRKKTGGRVKGKPSVCTEAIRSIWQDILSDNIELVNDDLKKLKPADRINALINISKIVLPNQQAITLDANVSSDKTIEDKLQELSETK